MSETFHVKGLHERVIDRFVKGEPQDAAHADDQPIRRDHSGKMAVLTAILATVGAVFSFMASGTQSSAALFKNEAVIKTTEASDQWNLYQAKSSKQNLAEIAMELVPTDRKPVYETAIKRYRDEKAEVMRIAREIEKKARDFNDLSEQQLQWHSRWSQATTVLQIAIALSAIALLTRRRAFEYSVFALSGTSLLLGVAAALHL